jgi:NAD(P)H-nitrite reductase
MNNKQVENTNEQSAQRPQGGIYLQRSLGQADIVVIGNGIAGLTAAIEARRLAPDKSVVIITEQTHPTINTPALKQFAIGKLAREQLLAYPAGTERAERIHIVNAHVTEIHAHSKYVSLQSGQDFGYGSLLLATGSQPMKLSDKLPGTRFDGVLTLHRLQDYLDLRRRIGEVNEAAVVGGGIHAIETIMGLLYWGIRVHWLIRGTSFMRNMLDEAASTLVINNMRRAGVQIHLETEISGIMGRVGSVAGIITNQSKMIPCQLVLSCIGVQPAINLAEQCSVSILLEHGIIVDDRLRTSVRDIYAAGDVAALKNPLSGKFEPRAQWYAATAQGRIAGAMMVGQPEQVLQPLGIHWHATHLGELSMLTVGEPLSKDPTVQILTDNSKGEYRRVAIKDKQLIGYLALGATQPDSLAIKRIIEEGIPIHDVLKQLLKGRFDARAYLTRRRSQSTSKLLAATITSPNGTTGELAAQRHQRHTDELFTVVTHRQTDPLHIQHQQLATGKAEPQSRPQRGRTAAKLWEYLNYEQTGNLKEHSIQPLTVKDTVE